jgi:hypothetical protein
MTKGYANVGLNNPPNNHPDGSGTTAVCAPYSRSARSHPMVGIAASRVLRRWYRSKDLTKQVRRKAHAHADVSVLRVRFPRSVVGGERGNGISSSC